MAFVGMLALFAAVILLCGPWSFSPVHKAGVNELRRNAAKVEQFCGKKVADAFRATHDPDSNTTDPMRDWVKRCTTKPESR